MHMIFTEEEKKWIDKNKFGWPIIEGCPERIRDNIEQKKKKIEFQMR